MNSNEKLLVCLYSDANFLALNILENLLSNGCLVNVVTDDIKNWKDRTEHLTAKNKFAFCKITDVNKDQIYNYIIFCSGFLSKLRIHEEYDRFCSLIRVGTQKLFILLPFETYKDNVDSIKISDNTAVIYLGDLLGPRLDLSSDLLMSSSLNEMIRERKLSVSIGEIFCPVFVPDVIRLIVKWMFAFGPYGKETFLLGSEISSSVFWKKNMALAGEIKLQYSNKIKPRTLPKGKEIQRIVSDLNFCLTETYRWISLNEGLARSKKTKVTKLVKQTKKKNSPHLPKKVKTILVSAVVFLIFPFIILLVCFGLLFISFRGFISGNNVGVKNTLEMSRTFAVIGGKESKVLSYIPLLGRIYKETDYVSYVLEDVSKAAEDTLPVTEDLAKLFNSILGSSPYDVTAILINTKNGLQSLYVKIGDIQNITESDAGNGTLTAKMVLSRVDFEKYMNLVEQGAILIDKTPALLGKGQSKTYLMLFENNMELRPTGGFIGSYGLLTFDEGRLSDFTVSDVYSADGQLNGHVEPPAPIKQYLGEANWWLRDSNWDPDFPTSAKRAEWFLDKEIDKQVDGVFAIDLSPVRDILKLTGPIFLPDYNLNISSDNLYEETQAEAQDNFFPGAHNKASFLTALSRSILGEVGGLNFKQKVNLLSVFYQNLEKRHMQIFLHDGESQNAIGSLNWDGSVNLPSCGDACYPDLLGVVEANVGVNKANYFIKRDSSLEINLNQNEIDRKYTLNIVNSSNPSLGLAGKYKNYVRFLIPGETSGFNIQSISGQSTENLTADVIDTKGRKEVGTLIEVLPGQSKKIIFSWKTQISMSQISSYGLYIRKQAGIDGYPISLSLSIPGEAKATDSRFTLTKIGNYQYNTTLDKDLFARFSF